MSPITSNPRDATRRGVVGLALPSLTGRRDEIEEKKALVGAEPSDAGPRDATRGGVNGPACRPRGGGKGGKAPSRSTAKQGAGDLNKLMYSGMVWEVGADGTRH